MSSSRKVQPGDLVDVIIQLRHMLLALDSAGYALWGDFSEVAPGLEKEVGKAQTSVRLAASRVNDLATAIEQTPTFQLMKKEVLARQKRLPEDEEE